MSLNVVSLVLTRSLKPWSRRISNFVAVRKIETTCDRPERTRPQLRVTVSRNKENVEPGSRLEVAPGGTSVPGTIPKTSRRVRDRGGRPLSEDQNHRKSERIALELLETRLEEVVAEMDDQIRRGLLRTLPISLTKVMVISLCVSFT